MKFGENLSPKEILNRVDLLPSDLELLFENLLRTGKINNLPNGLIHEKFGIKGIEFGNLQSSSTYLLFLRL
jgi:hypothetical protein